MKIILGSQSKWREQLLRDMGYEFEVLPSMIDERSIRYERPEDLTVALARAKAEALLPMITEPSLLITADQVITARGRIHEKPRDAEEVREFLRSYSKHPATSYTGLFTMNTETGESREGVDIATIIFSPIPEVIIEQLIAEGDVFTRAGAFNAEDERLKAYIKRIEGALDSVLGLPRELLRNFLASIAPDL